MFLLQIKRLTLLGNKCLSSETIASLCATNSCLDTWYFQDVPGQTRGSDDKVDDDTDEEEEDVDAADEEEDDVTAASSSCVGVMLVN